MNPYALAQVPFRLLFYAVALIYLLLDLGLKGPAYRRLESVLPGSPTSQEMGVRRGWAATVNGHPITKAQLDLALDLFLARRGKTRADLTRPNLGIAQLAVLDQLINDELVRLWSLAQPVEVREEVLEERVRQFEARFAPGELQKAMEKQGLSRGEMRASLREHARQQFWLEEKTREAYAVTDGETQEWYGLHGGAVRMPEMVRARHLFLSAGHGDLAAKEKLAGELAERLRRGRGSFEALCRQYSEDDRTKAIGGELGYFSRGRVLADFGEAVFGLRAGQVSGPIRTGIGWHIVEVQEKLPVREMTWEELRPEIAAYLENDWRRLAVEALLQEQLRIPRRARVEVFAPAMEVGPVKK